jgi:hypothetical protein
LRVNTTRIGRYHPIREDRTVSKRFLTALEMETETGTPASTFRYWALIDEGKAPEDKVGPPSCKLGRRRVWERAAFESWLAERTPALPALE